MGIRIERSPRSSQGQPRGQNPRSQKRAAERARKARMKARTTGSKQKERTRTGMISRGKARATARKNK